MGRDYAGRRPKELSFYDSMEGKSPLCVKGALGMQLKRWSELGEQNASSHLNFGQCSNSCRAHKAKLEQIV